MEETKTKPLSVKQACSKWVNKFAEDFLKGNPYSLRDLRWTKYDYIRLVNWFPNENIEDIVVDMFKTNYSVLSYFKDDQEKVNKEINDLFRNNNCINEFVDDLALFIKDVVEPFGQSKHEIFKTQTKDKLDHYDKIDRVYNTGIMEWNFVRNQFDKNMEFWKVKEAISWMVGYVENCGYDAQDLIIEGVGGRKDKYKTFDNLINKINESALTQENPFKKVNGKLQFCDAKAGEVDVMLWNEKNKNIVSMSATRDRGFKIEGNQFPRHYLKSLVLFSNILEFHDKKGVALTSKNVQKLVRHQSFKNLNTTERALKIDSHPSVKSEIKNFNVLAKDLSIVRHKISNLLHIDFQKNGLDITDKELSSILAYGEGKVDFVFFGELLEKKHMPIVQAGLNCLAYRDNFKRLGKFRMTNNASNIFMRSISKRFNSISPAEQHVETHGQNFIIELIKNTDDIEKNISNIQYFSEGNVYGEERACLFKSCSVLFRNVITELDKMDGRLRNGEYEVNDQTKEDVTNKAIQNGLKFFFDQGIEKENLESLTKFFSSSDKMDTFILNFDSIKTSISEVPLELEELEFCKERVVASFNNVSDRVEIAELKNLKNKLDNKNNETINKDEVSNKKNTSKKTYYRRTRKNNS